MAFTLPPSLDRHAHSVYDEVADARRLTPEERLVVVASVCRAALHALNLHGKREVVLELRDPVPESTRLALKRLRVSG